MISWTYKDKPILSHDDLPTNCTDFVYELTFKSGMKYIGKKTIRSESTLPVNKTKRRDGATIVTRHILRDEEGNIITSKAKRKAARSRGLKAKAEQYEVVVTNKPFLKYEGSSTENDGEELKSKEILFLTSTKKAATYIEVALLFENNVLFTSTYTNKNISGTFWDDSLDGLIE